jgi:eukaryotic-like serine/threonine-protein kinase
VPHVGTVIADRYALRERLANGSTGEVWLSEIADRPVVVKLLAEDIEAPVRGTPLIELIEQGRADGRAYLVLEHAPGGSLRDVLRREGRLSQTEAMAVLARVATVLQEAHLSGLVHRDLRPGHLLLRGDGSLAVADAGLAPGWFSSSSDAPDGARWAVRAPYLAPEQVRGAAVTAVTDVYALGVVTYECLTGRPPFDRPTQHLYEEPPPLPPEIAPAVRDVVLRALAKDPAKRWPTAQALAEAATQAALALSTTPDGAPSAAPVATPPARAGTLVRSAAARSARTPSMNRMPAMNPNDTTLDTLPPVPPEWDGPRRPRFAQPHYVAVAAGAAALLVALALVVPGLTSHGTFAGLLDPPTATADVELGAPGPHATNPDPSSSGLSSLLPSLTSGAPGPTGAGAGTIPGVPPVANPAPTTTVPGNPAPPAPPTASGVVTFKVAGNNPSPEFKEGSCVYRIWYANYGSTAFGKLRIYSGGNCLSASVQVAAARGTTISYESVGTPFISQNTDSCGSYFEIQATADATPAYAVGMSIRFAATGRTIVFAYDRGAAPTVVKNC